MKKDKQKQKNDKVKGEKGAITLFVLVAILFFLIILIGLFASSSNIRISQIRELEKIQENYKMEPNEIDKIYAEQIEKEEEGSYTIKYIKKSDFEAGRETEYNPEEWTNETIIVQIEYENTEVTENKKVIVIGKESGTQTEYDYEDIINNRIEVEENSTITPNTTNWTNKDVIGTVTYGSALTTNKKAGYGATLEAAKTAASTNTATSLTAPQNGYFYAEATDSMGNKVVTSLQISNIDKISPTISEDTLAGTMLFEDPTFATGTNSVVVYNNKDNGAVTITRKEMPDSPTGSGYGLEIKTTGESFPQHGGFTFAQRVADDSLLKGLLVYMNKIYIFKIIAKIPVGYQINYNSNSIGDNGTMTWKTSQQGTGEWEEYVGIVKCGDTGKMQTTLYCI